ncbi:MAG: hypothetical protein PVF65_06915 [Sphingomonadales bacterium]|jgi:hypothetical protein
MKWILLIAALWPWDTEITLEGPVVVEERYGPPNYGETPETDQKKLVTFLRHEDGDVQLILRGVVIKQGSCQRVTGTIFEGQSGHHYANAVIDVRKVKRC